MRVCEEMMISQNGSILAHDAAETCLCSSATNYCLYAPMIPFFVFLSLSSQLKKLNVYTVVLL